METGKFEEKGFSDFDVFPMFGLKLYGHHSAGRNVIDRFVPKLVDEVTYPVVMTKDDGRVKTIVKRLDRLDQVPVTETVQGFADLEIGEWIIEGVAEDHGRVKRPVCA